ncbi:CoA transferase [Microbacterium sp. Mu-80]|uniref:CoA transferase n=1 Tax=Microbacterium bandirmense TaxID=3122050 RepID=A0ABU8LF53_9MICO
MTDASNGALEGIRVLDLSRVLAGPLATMYLGDLGADVIKIEPPAGDETRAWVPPVDARGVSTYFTGVNRNKRGLRINLTRDEDREIVLQLAAEADVLVENFRPGVMERFGLDYESLSAGNPGLVYCSITGFGSGAGRELAGFDLLAQAQSGLMSVTGAPDGEPMKVGVALVDVLAGQNAVIGILSALRARERTRRGQRVEISLLSAALSGLANQSSSTVVTGQSPRRHGNAHPSIAPYQMYPTADGDLVIAVGNDRQFEALCRELGSPDLHEDPRFAANGARVAHRAELETVLVALLTSASAGEWAERLTARGVPAGTVNTIAQGLELAEKVELEPVVTIATPEGDARSVANPIRLSGTPVRYLLPPPDAEDHQTWNPRREP